MRRFYTARCGRHYQVWDALSGLMLEVLFERDAAEILGLLTGLSELGSASSQEGAVNPCRFVPIRTNQVAAQHRKWELTDRDEPWAAVDPEWWDVIDTEQDGAPVTSHMRSGGNAALLAGALNWAALGAHTRERFVAVWCHPDLYPTQEGDIEPEKLRWSVVDGETGLTVPDQTHGDETTMRALAGVLNSALRTHPKDQPASALMRVDHTSAGAFISISAWDWSSPVLPYDVAGELALCLAWLFDTTPPPPWVLLSAPGPRAAACVSGCARGVDCGPCLKGCAEERDAHAA